MRDYLQHGRRHLEKGSDPIPGLRYCPTEFMVASGDLVASGATPAYVDLDTWATSSEDVFTLELGTGGLSATHGLAIHEEGVYRVWAVWRVDSGTDGDTLEGELDIRSANVSFWSFGNTQLSPNTQVVLDLTGPPNNELIQTAAVLYIGGSAGPAGPVVLPAFVFVNALSQGGNAYHIEFTLLVERLAKAYTSNAVSNVPV